MLHPFMPYVTEEIYSSLPIGKEISIMTSKYPEYDKKLVFDDIEELIDKVIIDVTAIRNIKATNKITKEAYVSIKTDEKLYNIYGTALKINKEKVIEEKMDKLIEYNYKSNNIDITYYEEGSTNNQDNIIKEIARLEQSIEKRSKLLSNENYINKAPQNIVELDRQKLKEEQEQLNNLKELLK